MSLSAGAAVRVHDRRGRILVAIAATALLASLAVLAHVNGQTGRAIQSGNIRLGVTSTGDIGFGETPLVPSAGGQTTTGLRNLATNTDSQGELRWGGSFLSPTNVLRNFCSHDCGAGSPVIAPQLTALAGAADTQVVTQTYNELRVTHDFHPSTSPNVYEVQVTFQNVGSGTITDLRYGRANLYRFHIAPGPLDVQLSIGGATPYPSTLDWSGNNYGWRANPAIAYTTGAGAVGGCPSTGPPPGLKLGPPNDLYFTDFGYCTQGAAFAFKLGDLAPGQTRRIWMYLGIGTDTNLQDSLDADDYLVSDFQALFPTGLDVYATAQDQPDSANFKTDLSAAGMGFRGVQAPRVAFGFTSSPPAYPGSAWTTTTPCAGATVTFTPALSQAAPWVIVTAHWDYDGPGPLGWDTSNTHSFGAPGTYTVTLEAINDNGLTSTVTHTIVIVDCNVPPVGQPIIDLGAGDCVDSTVTFTTTPSDADGGVVLAQWWFGDEAAGAPASATGILATHVYATAGPMNGLLRLTDDEGTSVDLPFTLQSVGDPNCLPILATPPPVVGFAGFMASLTPTAIDGDGPALTIVAVTLPSGATFTPAPGTTSASASFVWDTAGVAPGFYEFPIQAVDGAGGTANGTLRIQVILDASDVDHDGIADEADNCPNLANHAQADQDGNGLGDGCDASTPEANPGPVAPLGPEAADRDRDGIADVMDNCVDEANHEQTDLDHDGQGDACDLDRDGDGVAQTVATGFIADLCPDLPDARQTDTDGDGVGDGCDDDPLAAPVPAAVDCASCGAAVPMRADATGHGPLLAAIIGGVGCLIIVFAAGRRRRGEE